MLEIFDHTNIVTCYVAGYKSQAPYLGPWNDTFCSVCFQQPNARKLADYGPARTGSIISDTIGESNFNKRKGSNSATFALLGWPLGRTDRINPNPPNYSLSPHLTRNSADNRNPQLTAVFFQYFPSLRILADIAPLLLPPTPAFLTDPDRRHNRFPILRQPPGYRQLPFFHFVRYLDFIWAIPKTAPFFLPAWWMTGLLN